MMLSCASKTGTVSFDAHLCPNTHEVVTEVVMFTQGGHPVTRLQKTAPPNLCAAAWPHTGIVLQLLAAVTTHALHEVY